MRWLVCKRWLSLTQTQTEAYCFHILIFFLTSTIHLHTLTMFYDPTLDTVPLGRISNFPSYQIFSHKASFYPVPYSSFWLSLQKKKKIQYTKKKQRKIHFQFVFYIILCKLFYIQNVLLRNFPLSFKFLGWYVLTALK